MHPPDVAPGALVRVRAWRAWPKIGVGVSLVAAALVSWPFGVPPAVATACLVYLGGFVVLGVAAFPERRLVRQVWAADPGEAAVLDDVLSEARVRLLAELMCAADEACADGELSAEEHRDVWRYVYEQVGALLSPAAALA